MISFKTLCNNYNPILFTLALLNTHFKTTKLKETKNQTYFSSERKKAFCYGVGSAERGSLEGGITLKIAYLCFQGVWMVLDVDISSDQCKMCGAKLSGTEGWREVLLSGADLWEPPDISDKGVRGRAWVWASSAAPCSRGRVGRKKRPKSLPLASAPKPTLFCFCGGVDASGWDGPERGSGQVVPGPHWEQDTGFRNRPSLKLLFPGDLVKLRIPFLPNTSFVISSLQMLFETFSLFLNITLFDAFVFPLIKITALPLGQQSSQPIIINFSPRGSKLPLTRVGDVAKDFWVNFASVLQISRSLFVLFPWLWTSSLTLQGKFSLNQIFGEN